MRRGLLLIRGGVKRVSLRREFSICVHLLVDFVDMG
jgi:hypothetical protein